MSILKKGLATGLTAALLVSTVLSGCGSTKQAAGDDATSFDYLLAIGVESRFYDGDYNQNPIAKYWNDMEWDADGDGEGTRISVNFITPPEGGESDYFNTLMATGEYGDIINLSYSSDNASTLYEEGIALDLTEYVENYMPNYKAWLEAHPSLASQMTNDGKYIMLYTLADQPEEAWGGYMYRRDWILKYGTNPETGEAFTGGWNEDKTEWTDDIVFPSGNTDPIYISDWEWMLDIFQTAIDTNGYDTGYAYQQYSAGYLATGDFNSGFGAPMGYYIDDDGICKEGMTTDNARAYLQCMNSWYEKGWINKDFEENTNDVFFMVDTANVYGGFVGSWYGLISQLGNTMDTGDAATDGICVWGARQPINDVYGDESCQGKEPMMFYQEGLVATGVVITDKAADKDIATLCAAFDYLYSTEGGLLHQYGFSDEQQAEVQDEFYKEWGMDNGVYTTTYDDAGNATYHIDPQRDLQSIGVPLSFVRVIGQSVNSNIDWGRDEIYDHGVSEMGVFTSTGAILSTVTNQLTADQSNDYGLINTNCSTYASQAVPDFITGRTDIDNDADWQAYVDEIKSYGVDRYCGYINEILGN